MDKAIEKSEPVLYAHYNGHNFDDFVSKVEGNVWLEVEKKDEVIFISSPSKMAANDEPFYLVFLGDEEFEILHPDEFFGRYEIVVEGE